MIKTPLLVPYNAWVWQLMLVSSLVSAASFFLPLGVGECREVPTDLADWSPAGEESVRRLVTFNCRHGYYNEASEQGRLIRGFPRLETRGESPET